MVDSLPRRGDPPHPLLRRFAYPGMLLTVLATAVVAIAEDWDPGLVSPIATFAVLGAFALLERLIPFEPEWQPKAREWGLYALYFLFTALGTAIAQAVVAAVVGAIAPPEPGWPLVLELPAALLLGSLGGYAFHRASHRNRFLWRLHGVHHAPDKVNVGNNGVNHVLDITLAQVLVQISLALAGFSAQSVFAVGLFVVLQGYFTHANVDVGIGWFNHVLASPEQHRLHHSTDLAEAGHFGSDLSVWDHLFGSYTWRPGRVPEAIGLVDPTTFPHTDEVVATLLHPLRPRRRAPRPGG